MRGTSGGFMVLPSVGKRIPSEGDKHPETLCFVIPYFFLGSWCFKMLYWEEKMYIIYTMGNDVVIGLKLPLTLSTFNSRCSQDRGVRSLFKFIAKIKENGGFPVHFIRAQREESEGGSSDGASAEPEPETSSQAGSEPEAEGTVCDSSSDSPLPVGNSDPSAEAAVTPTTASLDGSGKAESAPVLPASLESPAADNEAKKEVSKPPQKLINLAPSKPVAPTKAWRGPCRDDESDDEVCVVGSFSCQPVAEGTSTSCKASRKEVLEAELRGLRQQLEAKRMEATKKDLPGHGF